MAFITGHGTAETAIEAIKMEAYDYLVTPLDADRLREIVEQAFTISRPTLRAKLRSLKLSVRKSVTADAVNP